MSNLLSLPRRTFLTTVSAAALSTAVGAPAFAQRRQAAKDVSVEELMKATALPDIIQGKADAPVTIIEYASSTCPACAAFHATMLPKIKEKFIDTGKARLIVREMAFSDEANAVFMLARCAGNDKRDAVLNVFFQTLNKWGPGPKEGFVDRVFTVAKQVGFTQDAFNKCLTDQKMLDGVTEIAERGEKVFGVNSTPSFFVNGKPTIATNLEAAIEAALPKS